MPGPWGVPGPRGGAWSGGVPGPRGVLGPRGPGPGGGLLLGGELVSQHALRPTPPPGRDGYCGDGTLATGMHSCTKFAHPKLSYMKLNDTNNCY